jgi:hypothetical protein
VVVPSLPNLEENVAKSRCENQSTNERNWAFADEMISGSRTMITIKNRHAKHSKEHGMARLTKAPTAVKN